MLELNPFSLIFILGGLIFLAAVLLHYHNCSSLVRKKRMEVCSLSCQLKKKIHELEEEIVDLQLELDGVNEQIRSLQQ